LSCAFSSAYPPVTLIDRAAPRGALASLDPNAWPFGLSATASRIAAAAALDRRVDGEQRLLGPRFRRRLAVSGRLRRRRGRPSLALPESPVSRIIRRS